MSKAQIVRRFADEFGTKASDARRFVRNVGPRQADEMAAASRSGDSSAQFPWRTAIAGATATSIGGGALAWREQDIREAEAMADNSQNIADAIKDIAESDLPPELQQELAEAATGAASPGGGGGDDGFSWSDLWPGMPDLGIENIAIVMLVLVVVLMLVNNQMTNAPAQSVVG